jgi:putative ABC transport system permease protein
VIFTAYLIELLVLGLIGVCDRPGAGRRGALGHRAGARRRQAAGHGAAGALSATAGLAALFGALVAIAFSLWPLARARLVAPAGLFRGAILPRPTVVPFADRLVALLVATGLGALAVLSTGDRRLAGWFILAALVTLALFRVLGLLAMVAARAAGRPRRPWLRLALANLYRPGAATPSVVLSLGLGLTVLVAVSLVEASLTEEVEGRLAEAAPSFFFIDIQPDEAVPFAALVQQSPGVSDFTSVPNLRGRIARIKDVPAAQANVDPDRRQLVDSERGLTYADAVPRGSRIVAGEWWPKDYAGPPLVSLDQGLAEGLHLKLGDSISVDIAGREITGTLANLRQIDWTSLGINFFMVFSPGVLDGAPQTRIATVRVDTPAHEEALSKAVGDRFPNVSAVRVRDELERVRTLLAGLSALVEATAAISIASGLLVLSGAVAAGHRRRVYDAVVLKVLGATRPMLLRGYLIEYGALGAATALLAVVLGTVAAWLVVVKVMRADWSFAAGPVALTVLGGIGLTLLVALGGTWRALGARAVVQLRQD